MLPGLEAVAERAQEELVAGGGVEAEALEDGDRAVVEPGERDGVAAAALLVEEHVAVDAAGAGCLQAEVEADGVAGAGEDAQRHRRLRVRPVLLRVPPGGRGRGDSAGEQAGADLEAELARLDPVRPAAGVAERVLVGAVERVERRLRQRRRRRLGRERPLADRVQRAQLVVVGDPVRQARVRVRAGRADRGQQLLRPRRRPPVEPVARHRRAPVARRRRPGQLRRPVHTQHRQPHRRRRRRGLRRSAGVDADPEPAQDEADRIRERAVRAAREEEGDRVVRALGDDQRAGVAACAEAPGADPDLVDEVRRLGADGEDELVADFDRDVQLLYLAARELGRSPVLLHLLADERRGRGGGGRPVAAGKGSRPEVRARRERDRGVDRVVAPVELDRLEGRQRADRVRGRRPAVDRARLELRVAELRTVARSVDVVVAERVDVRPVGDARADRPGGDRRVAGRDADRDRPRVAQRRVPRDDQAGDHPLYRDSVEAGRNRGRRGLRVDAHHRPAGCVEPDRRADHARHGEKLLRVPLLRGDRDGEPGRAGWRVGGAASAGGESRCENSCEER